MTPDMLPRKTPMGLDVDSGNFPEVFDRTLAMSDRKGYSERVSASAAKGLRRGFAIAPYMECSGGGAEGIRWHRLRAGWRHHPANRLSIDRHGPGNVAAANPRG